MNNANPIFSALFRTFLNFFNFVSLVASVTAALSNMGTLSSLLPPHSVGNKPSILGIQSNSAALEEVKKKVAKQANSISIKEFTDVRPQCVCVCEWVFRTKQST